MRAVWPRRALLAALAAVIVVAPLWFWDGGVLEEETISFIRHYLDGRSLTRQVFDPHTNDFGTYQARELSYLVDALDARFFRWLLVNDQTRFFNLSVLVAGLLTIPIVLIGAPRAFPRLPPEMALVALMVYVSTCVLSSTQGVFYRATKPLVALCLLVALLALRTGTGAEVSGRQRWRWAALLLGVTLVATLLDRQGFFETAVGAVCVGLVALTRRTWRPPAIALATATVLGLAYNYVLGPWLVESVNGYRPSFHYQQFSIDDLATFAAAERGIHLTLVFVGSFVGSLNAFSVLGLILVTFACWKARPGVMATPSAESSLDRGIPILALGLFVTSQFLLVALMVARQPYMYDIRDGWRWYHPLPIHALLLFGLLWLLEACRPAPRSWSARALVGGLVLLIAANLLEWPRNRNQMQQGPWFGKVSRQSELLSGSLSKGEAQPDLSGQYRKFYFYCLESSDSILGRSQAQAGEGRGFHPAEVRDGRPIVASRPTSQIRLLAPQAGRYRLRAEVWLSSPGGVLVVQAPDGGSAKLTCGPGCLGPLRLDMPVGLPRGTSEARLALESAAPTAPGTRNEALSIALPLTLERANAIALGPTECEVIRVAEDFVLDNGYTLAPPKDKSKIQLELADRALDLDRVLRIRHDTLKPRARRLTLGAHPEGPVVWMVAFEHSDRLRELDARVRGESDDQPGGSLVYVKIDTDKPWTAMAHGDFRLAGPGMLPAPEEVALACQRR